MSTKETQQEIATPVSMNVPRKDRTLKKFSTKWLTYTAVFSALALALKLLGQVLTLNDVFKVTLIYSVWLVAAAVLGPIGGGTVGFISDFLGAIILPTGVFNPLLTVGCALYGVIAGLCFKLPLRTNYMKFIVAGAVCTVTVSLIFDSAAIWIWCKYVLKLGSFMDRTLIVYLGMRMAQCLMGAINIPVAIAMIPLLNRLRLLPKIKPNVNGISEKIHSEAKKSEEVKSN